MKYRRLYPAESALCLRTRLLIYEALLQVCTGWNVHNHGFKNENIHLPFVDQKWQLDGYVFINPSRPPVSVSVTSSPLCIALCSNFTTFLFWEAVQSKTMTAFLCGKGLR